MTTATPLPTSIGAQALAELLDLTPRRLQQLAGDGVVVRGAEDRDDYQLVASLQGYIRFLRERSDAPDGASHGDVRTSRAKFIKLQAEKLEMDLRERAEELLPAGEVRQAWQAQVAAWNSVLTNSIPELVAAAGTAQGSDQLLRAITSEIDRIRSQLADTDPLAQREVINPVPPVLDEAA